MCNTKASGKGRCLAHHPASQYAVRSVTYKTGDRVVVTQSLSELSREGKKMNLPDPSKAEVAAWVDKERFAQQFDPKLDDHERKIQGNQLEKAAAYVQENEVPANHFYAWKNLFKRVKENTAKRMVALGMIAGMTPAFLSGCFANDGAVQPNPGDLPETPPTISEPIGSGMYGDIESGGLEGTGVIVSDFYGDFETLKLPDDSPLYKLDKSIVDSAVYEKGFTDDDILTLQKNAIDFIVKEAVDSDRYLDVYHTDDEYASHVSKYFTDSNIFTVANPASDVVPSLLRDGKPRITAHTAKVEKIWLVNDTTIGVQFTGAVLYRTTNGAVVNLLNARGFSNEEMVSKGIPQDVIDNPDTIYETYPVTYDYSLSKQVNSDLFNGVTAKFRDYPEQMGK